MLPSTPEGRENMEEPEETWLIDLLCGKTNDHD